MAALGWAAVDQSLHELAQAYRVERAVLHLILNQIDVRGRELLPFLVTGAVHADVVDGLPGLEQFDHLVEAFGFVAGVPTLGRYEATSGRSRAQGQARFFSRQPRFQCVPTNGAEWCQDTLFPEVLYAVVSDGCRVDGRKRDAGRRRRGSSRRKRFPTRWLRPSSRARSSGAAQMVSASVSRHRRERPPQGSCAGRWQ